MSRWGLRQRAMLLGVLPALMIALLLGMYFSYSRIHDAEQGLRERGAAQARHLAAAAEYGVVTYNQEFLQNLLDAQSAEADMSFAAIYQTACRSRPVASCFIWYGRADGNQWQVDFYCAY